MLASTDLQHKWCHLPLKSGATFQIEIGPRPPNWPKLNSRKNSGIPHMIKKVRYGIKNAPVDITKVIFY